MLVLTRAKNQRIIIEGGITITVNKIWMGEHGKPRVSLGIAAPPGVRVDREEIHQKIQAELAALEATDGVGQ